MSRDIRSFFQVQKAKKPVIDDDDDIIPESPDVHIKTKKKESRKKRVLEDSDEEIFAKKKKPSQESSHSKKNKTPVKPVLKEVKVVDLFGNGPLKRTEPMVKKVKKTETGIHSDEEFEKSLLEVDTIEETTLKESKVTKSPIKNHEDVIIIEDKSPVKSKDIKINDDVKLKVSSTSKETLEVKKEHKTENGEASSKKDRKTAIDNVFGDKKMKRDTESNEDMIKKETKNHDKDSDKKEKKKHAESNETTIKKETNHDKDVRETNGFTTKRDKGESSKKDLKKRDFAEFTENNESFADDEKKQKNKKTKLDKSLNESVLTDEERHERKIHSAALYQRYLNRSGPKHLGAKQIPVGSPNCLVNCAFLLTGVLDSFEREEVTDAVTKHGGCIKNGISKKVTHVLAGEDAGPAKMAKAQELGIKILNEDEFLQLIIDSSKKNNKTEKQTLNEKHDDRKSHKSRHSSKESSKDKDKLSSHKRESKNHDDDKTKRESSKNRDVSRSKIEMKSKSPSKVNHESKIEIKPTKISETVKQECSGIKTESSKVVAPNSIMWVDKYKPQNVKQIIGQHGDASNVKKLMTWLTKWYVNRKAKLPKPSPWAKNDDGGYYKAVLLSGPPGVGKTTTVSLVCKELGFDAVEFNASDTRSKSLIKEQIGELLTTTSLAAYARGAKGKQAITKKHVLVMDEVDGMAGNEDRGGLQELIALIKTSSVPIVCMCNDRNSQKMRSLVNYCYDLRFNRPRVEQIKSAMMSICCKEGIKIPPDALTQLIVAANQDVRQTLNSLSLWAVDTSIGDAESLKRDANSSRKDVKLGPWDAIRKVFSAEDHKTMSINDRSDLFFYDYSLAPLFVQENYLQVAPHCPKHEVLERISLAADSISQGDLVEARIRRNQAWNLLPLQAMCSSVIPGHHMAGHMAGQIQFPSWLGKNSRANKMHRLCQEIHAHTRLSTSGSKSSIFLDYATYLRDAIVTPLVKEGSDGVSKSLEVLEAYHLLRDDLDSLVELSLWPGQRNPMILVESKVKAAMTRTYNKTAMALPYAPGAVKRGRAKDDDNDDDEAEDEEDGDDSDPENDALIKKKKTEKPKSKEKPSTKEKPGPSKDKASTTKDKPGTSKPKKK